MRPLGINQFLYIPSAVPPMTGPTAPAGNDASVIGSGYLAGAAWNAFDLDPATEVIGPYSTGGINRKFPAATRVTNFTVLGRNTDRNFAILQFSIQGGPDGSSWTNIQSYVTSIGDWTTGVPKAFPIATASQAAYLWYRLVVTASYNWGGGGQWVISEWQMYA